jgi:phosphoglycolate phosphatase-like HAD superfamily hydrolase
VHELFARIWALGRQTALASSCRSDELQTYKRLARIDDLVTTETTTDDTEKSKPHPDSFRTVLDRLETIEPSEALVVGDSPDDAQAAGKLKLSTVSLLCGGFPEDKLRAAACTAIFADPTVLLDRYNNLLLNLHQP